MNSLNINKHFLSKYIAITKMGPLWGHSNRVFRGAKQGFDSLPLRISNAKVLINKFNLASKYQKIKILTWIY